MKTSILAAGLMMLFLCQAAACPAQSGALVDQVRKESLQSVSTRAKTQEMVNEFIHQEARLKDRIDTLRAELELASKHRRKTQAYVNTQQAALDEVNRQIGEAEKIKTRLDPMLDDAWQKLEAAGAQCPPWEKMRVQGRAAEVKRVLDNYEAGPAAKVLAVLGEMRRRAAEVNTVSVYEGEIEIKGSLLRASLFRLGGLSWYALGMDGRKSWMWNQADQSFESVDSMAGQLAKAVEIAEKHRVISLVELPLIQGPAYKTRTAAKGKAHE